MERWERDEGWRGGMEGREGMEVIGEEMGEEVVEWGELTDVGVVCEGVGGEEEEEDVDVGEGELKG